MTGPRGVVVALVAGVVAGALVVVLPAVVSNVPLSVLQPVFAALAVGVAIWSVSICRTTLARDRRLSHVGSAVFAGGLLIAVLLPGAQLASGGRTSRLERSGFPQADPVRDIKLAYALFALALVAFVVGEGLAALRRRPRGGRRRALLIIDVDSKAVYAVLIAIGLAMALVVPAANTAEGFANRGQATGQGLTQLLGYSLPLAVTLGVSNRHWGSKSLAALSAVLLVAFVLQGGTRTPLLIVGGALLVRLLIRPRSRGAMLRSAVFAAVAVYVGAVLLVGISTWRFDVRFGIPTSLPGAIVAAAKNPFAQLSKGGVDTLDGMVLSTKVDRAAAGVTWTDPSKIVLEFIPHQIWPSKPEFLGPLLTRGYLDVSTRAGVFLSGPGYAYIVFGGVLGMTLCFFALGALSETIYRRLRPASVFSALLTFFWIFFLFGGDAFPAFFTLGLVFLLLFAAAVSRAAGGAIAFARRNPAKRPVTI